MAYFTRKKTLIPDKPHFFRSLVSDFQNKSIDIPVFFWKNFLGGLEPEEALLRSSQLGKVWHVKLNGNRIVEGWKEFYGAHDLKLGDFVVFRHEGDLVFDVMVFEPSACLREYQIIPKEEECDVEKSDYEQNIIVSESRLKERKRNKQEVVNGGGENGHCSGTIARPIRCEVTIRPYNVSNVLFLPKEFTKETVLDDRQCCQVTLRDERGRLWAMKLEHREPSNAVFFCKDGWQKFRIGKSLKDGDTFLLQLVNGGKNPLLTFRRLNGNHCNHHEMTSSKRKDTGLSSGYGKSSHAPKPFFCGTIRPSTINGKWFKLVILKNFARSHGLINRDCEMMLKNQKGKSWLVRLSYNRIDGVVYIGEGFRKFALENDLEEGDNYKLMLIQGGKKPVMLYCHVGSSEGTRSKRKRCN